MFNGIVFGAWCAEAESEKENAMKISKRIVLAAFAAASMSAMPLVAETGKAVSSAEKQSVSGSSAMREKKGKVRNRDRRNVAIAVDFSASIGERLFENLKDRAIKNVESLADNDFVSLVSFGERVEVLCSARPATDETKKEVAGKIKALKRDSKSALFAGISKGAGELRKNAGDGIESKIEIYSCGNMKTAIGPSGDEELARLAGSLAKEKIKVSGAIRKGKQQGARPGSESRARRHGKRSSRLPAGENAEERPRESAAAENPGK